MRYDLTFGGISWIDPKYVPDVNAALVASTVSNAWFVKTLMGLAATANYDPPRNEISDFAARKANSKAHRGLLGGRLIVEADGPAPAALKVVQTYPCVVDGGYTPPVSRSKFPSMTVARLPWDTTFHPGEVSDVSGWQVGKPHPYGTLAAPAGHQLVAHGLVKFRAGQATDDTGVSFVVGAPFHVPWVWNELLVSYAAGKVRVTAAGSIFPSHAWYLGGHKRYTLHQVGDKDVPGEWVFTPAMGPGGGGGSAHFFCKPEQSRLYRVLAKGASSKGPQASLADEGKYPNGRAVTTQSHTVESGQTVHAEVELAALPRA